jgi:hypothetical protein
MVGMRPMRRLRRVIAFCRSSFAKTGMITTSLIASHVSIRPVKDVTSRAILARTIFSTSSSEYSASQSGASVCQTSGWPLTVTPRSRNHAAAVRSRSVSGRPSTGSKPAQ